MHDSCMAIKTISLELDAYEKLRRAKRDSRESFSNVVRRASWDDLTAKAQSLLADLRELSKRRPEILLSSETLDRLERRKRPSRRRSQWGR